MSIEFSRRIGKVPTSFLREVFKIISDERIISFGGGLPNPNLFPTDAFARAAEATLHEAPHAALQYGTTEGIPELRTLIAESYARKDDIEVHPDEVIITNGSQQGLDLLGKALIDEGGTIFVEDPTYLAALQAFSMYEAEFVSVPLLNTGMDTDALETALREHGNPKMLYTIPNFHNPSGITYDEPTRKRIAELINPEETLLVEDDPYGEIRFEGQRGTPFAKLTPSAALLGSFSKIVAPGVRLGWIVVRDPALRAKVYTAKQASDLHSSTLIQHIVYRYYRDNDSDAHVRAIASAYKEQRDVMLKALDEYIGDRIHYTVPQGGMFTWVTLPEHIDAMKLFDIAIKEGVAFVPGETFHAHAGKKNTMRVNYTNSTPEEIREGVQRLARAIERYDEQ